jgi:hypothetical protein
MKKLSNLLRWTLALSVAALVSFTLSERLVAQDQPDQDDPPTRVARLGEIAGSVSFQPAGQSDWVEAAWNRPMTTGDQVWVDRDSHAELGLGSAVIELDHHTGLSFLNLDDHTIQIQLTAGAINIRVRRLGRDDVFEVDTPNIAFSIFETGFYRIDAGQDGSYTIVRVREGEGEATGSGQSYSLESGQRATFSGTDSLNAEMQEMGGLDDFDRWSYDRDHRYENSISARYVSHDVVGYEDLDANGDWRPAMGYGNVWFPRVQAGWAPYREGHWAWIDPWGWTWVDDEPWGYAPFHYGRWVSVEGRWGWMPGPIEVAPVYAPALVVFIGGGPGGFGGNVGWFPLGPREVYVPSYPVSRAYVERVNISNTTVNTTVINNVYNTTIINKTTNITNITYANRGVAGAVTAVPQQAFVSAQPVARAAVAVNAKEVASMQVSSRAALAPTANSVLGAHANTAGRAPAPPAAIAHLAVVAKTPPAPAPVPFAARQQALEAHPGQPIARQEMRQIQQSHPVAAAARPQIRQAPPSKPATPITAAPANRPGSAPANQPMNRPGNAPAANQPMNRPGNEPNQPTDRPANEPAYRPGNPPAQNERPVSQPNNRPAPAPPQDQRPEANRPQNPPAQNNRPVEPPARQAQPNNRPAEPPARTDRPPAAPPQNRPEAERPAPPPQRNEPVARPAPPAHQPTPAEKKKQEEDKKKEKPPQG